MVLSSSQGPPQLVELSTRHGTSGKYTLAWPDHPCWNDAQTSLTSRPTKSHEKCPALQQVPHPYNNSFTRQHPSHGGECNTHELPFRDSTPDGTRAAARRSFHEQPVIHHDVANPGTSKRSLFTEASKTDSRVVPPRDLSP